MLDKMSSAAKGLSLQSAQNTSDDYNDQSTIVRNPEKVPSFEIRLRYFGFRVTFSLDGMSISMRLRNLTEYPNFITIR